MEVKQLLVESVLGLETEVHGSILSSGKDLARPLSHSTDDGNRSTIRKASGGDFHLSLMTLFLLLSSISTEPRALIAASSTATQSSIFSMNTIQSLDNITRTCEDHPIPVTLLGLRPSMLSTKLFLHPIPVTLLGLRPNTLREAEVIGNEGGSP